MAGARKQREPSAAANAAQRARSKKFSGDQPSDPQQPSRRSLRVRGHPPEGLDLTATRKENQKNKLRRQKPAHKTRVSKQAQRTKPDGQRRAPRSRKDDTKVREASQTNAQDPGLPIDLSQDPIDVQARPNSIIDWLLHTRLPEDTSDPEFDMDTSMRPPPRPEPGIPPNGIVRLGQAASTQASSMGKQTTKSDNSRLGNLDQQYLEIMANNHPYIKSYMREYDGSDGEEGPCDASKAICDKLLRTDNKHKLPDPRYEERLVFKSALERLESKNETGLQHFLHDLVCPPAEYTAARIERHPVLAHSFKQIYGLLAEGMDENWNINTRIFPNQIVVRRPKPDYFVGFRVSKFSEREQGILAMVPGIPNLWIPTPLVCFPFLTVEAKHFEGIEKADRQNTNSMTVAIMAVVQLFQHARCERLLHRKVLGFSLSYNRVSVTIFCHYPVLKGRVTKIYRSTIDTFRYEMNRYQDRWKSYNFVRNVYEMWAPQHFKDLCDALSRCSPPSDLLSADNELAARASQLDVQSNASTVRASRALLRDSAANQQEPEPDSVLIERTTAAVLPDSASAQAEPPVTRTRSQTRLQQQRNKVETAGQRRAKRPRIE